MRYGVSIVLLLAVFGCSEEFNPVAEGERPYVVFALLNSSVQTQIVRVHETSPPSEANPGNPPIPGTVVELTGPQGTMQLRDTVLVPPAGAYDTASVQAYVLDPFMPTRGASYTLSITSPRGNASATMTVPGTADLSTTDFFALQGPYSYPTEKSISLRALLNPVTLGYVARLLIEYERLDGGVWKTETREVPSAYRGLVDEDNYTAVYPALTRRVSSRETSVGGLREPESAVFRNGVYLQTLSILYRTYNRANLRMKRVMFILTQADTHFFTYYSFANFFQDRLTIRVDQPDYSNVSGALGFFGSLTADTLAFPLPPDLGPPIE